MAVLVLRGLKDKKYSLFGKIGWIAKGYPEVMPCRKKQRGIYC
jgi:hypothetical protein